MTSKPASSRSRKKTPVSVQKRKTTRRSPVKKSEQFKGRALFLVTLLCLCFTGLGGRLVWWGFVPAEAEPSVRVDKQMVMPVRGSIYDRNGLLLATTLKVHSLYADPKMMIDPYEAAEKLTRVFPDLDYKVLEKRFSNPRTRFVWVRRHLTPAQARQVNELGIPGLGFREESARVYPQENLASHVLGATSVDGRGLAGIESSYDRALASGEDLHLTIDSRVQQQLRDVLMDTWKESDAKAVWGAVLDTQTADVLALVNLPDFSPNAYGDFPKDSWRNNMVDSTFEVGSVFKIFTVAEAFEDHVATPETLLDCTKPIRIAGFSINDSHPKYEWMSVQDVFRRSSNIGVSRLSDMFEEGAQQNFYRRLGFLESMDIGFNDGGPVMYPNREWGRVHRMTMSFGHGIGITPVHLLAAVNAVVGDGFYRQPSVVLGGMRERSHRVVSSETVEAMRSLMRVVVQDGTGRNSKVNGFDIGGKTGTAEKSKAGGYSRKKNLASFVGAVPMHNPKFVALIMVDEGKEHKNSGGTVAAPAFGELVKRVAPIMGLRPETPEAMMAHSLNMQKASYETVSARR